MHTKDNYKSYKHIGQTQLLLTVYKSKGVCLSRKGSQLGDVIQIFLLANLWPVILLVVLCPQVISNVLTTHMCTCTHTHPLLLDQMHNIFSYPVSTSRNIKDSGWQSEAYNLLSRSCQNVQNETLLFTAGLFVSLPDLKFNTSLTPKILTYLP